MLECAGKFQIRSECPEKSIFPKTDKNSGQKTKKKAIRAAGSVPLAARHASGVFARSVNRLGKLDPPQRIDPQSHVGDNHPRRFQLRISIFSDSGYSGHIIAAKESAGVQVVRVIRVIRVIRVYLRSLLLSFFSVRISQP